MTLGALRCMNNTDVKKIANDNIVLDVFIFY
jgi:hypothetical protein